MGAEPEGHDVAGGAGAEAVDGMDAADAALVAAITSRGGVAEGELVDIGELAEGSGLPPAVIEALVREGLLSPRVTNPPQFTRADIETVRDGTRLIEAGIPLAELLALARTTDEALREVADQAVDIFLRFVRDPVRGEEGGTADASAKLVAAFETMLPATGRLLSQHFEQLVVRAAEERVRGADR